MQTVAGEKINLCALFWFYIKHTTFKIFQNNEHIQTFYFWKMGHFLG